MHIVIEVSRIYVGCLFSMFGRYECVIIICMLWHQVCIKQIDCWYISRSQLHVKSIHFIISTICYTHASIWPIKKHYPYNMILSWLSVKVPILHFKPRESMRDLWADNCKFNFWHGICQCLSSEASEAPLTFLLPMSHLY